MRNFTVTRIWGIPIRINISLLVFLPILAWLIGSGAQIEAYAGIIENLTGVGFDLSVLQAGSTPWVIGVVAAVGLFVSVTLHELGHSWVALRYGLEIESITLWILGGLAALKSIPREWNREFWIAIAGPIASVLTGAGCYAVAVALPESSQVIRFVFGWLAVVNVTLAVFNLLPAFPMDGGRILRALLARSRPYGSATRIAARIGVIFAILFAVVGVFAFNVILILLALFVYGAATTESRTVLVDELLEGLTVGDVVTRDGATVAADAPVQALAERILDERRTLYGVTDDAGDVIGVVTLDDLRRVRSDDRPGTTVGQIARGAPRIPATADAFETFAQLTGSGDDTVIVEEDGRVVGVLTQADFSRALTFQREFGAVVAQ